MLFQELVHGCCQETSCKDFVQRPHDANGDLAQRYPRAFEQRFYFEILYRELLWRPLIDTLYRQPYKEILHTSFYTEPVTETSHTRSYIIRDLHKGHLQNLTWHLSISASCSLQHCLGSLAGIIFEIAFAEATRNHFCWRVGCALATRHREFRERLREVASTAQARYAVPTRNTSRTREAKQGYADWEVGYTKCFHNNFTKNCSLGQPCMLLELW